ncbi:MAG: hypothetical protein K6F48_11385 [Paludibacteraceae bacterium]|nr:hypothetical protein [Paludibacteraceae bacterium]
MKEKIKSASEWQGGDLYAGIDSYEKINLKAGTELYALIAYNKAGKMNTCEYFFPKNELGMAEEDATKLSRMLQIAPWENPETKECSYKKELIVFKLKSETEVETGKTAENTAYGEGGMTQYYIPSEGKTFNDILTMSKFGDGGNSKTLSNNKMKKEDYGYVMERLSQLQLRRNLFCAQKAKLDTLDIIQNSAKKDDVDLAQKNLTKLDKDIFEFSRKIKESIEVIGKVPSPLYDSLNKQSAEEIKLREGKENVLVLGNAKVEQSFKETSEVVLGNASLNVVTLEEDKAQAVAQNLFKKIDEYDPEKNWNDIDVKNQGLVDVMNINRINKECQKVMAEEALRPRDFQSLERIALPTFDGKAKEYRLSELFDEKSVQKIRSAQNGQLTEPLQMKNGQTAKLMMLGNKAHLFLGQPKENLAPTLDKMSLGDTERKRLLKGETIAHNQTHVKLDKDLNCVVAGTAGRLSPPKENQSQKMDSPEVKRSKKKKGGISL